MENITDLFKVLSDETRLRIIHLLFHQDLCVCELVEILELPQPKISKHIAKLRQINLVKTQRNEQYIYYSFNKDNNPYKTIVTDTLESLKDYQILEADLKRLNTIDSFVCSN